MPVSRMVWVALDFFAGSGLVADLALLPQQQHWEVPQFWQAPAGSGDCVWGSSAACSWDFAQAAFSSGVKQQHWCMH